MEAIYTPWVHSIFLPSPSHKYLFAIWMIILVCGIIFIKKSKRDLLNLNKIVTVFSSSLVLCPTLNIAKVQLQRNEKIQLQTHRFSQSKKIDRLHDIYYIILDEYTSSENLKRFFNYDNSSFENQLKQSGFYVCKKNSSNYAVTFLSLASSLNMNYINGISKVVGEKSTDWEIPYNLVLNNNVMNFLKSKNYQFIHFSSRYDATDYNPFADVNYSHTILNNFSVLLAQTTMIRAFVNFRENDLRNSILYTFSELNKVTEIKGNKFVFAHIVCPHVPFVFGKNGEKVKVQYRNDWKCKEAYVNQLIFINKKVEALVRNIISKSENPPIIILQADHGTATSFENISLHNHKAPSSLMLKERMGILNAYYLPDAGKLLYDSITPVNTFRVIFNSYFNTNLPILPDKNYFSNYDTPYDLTDVTEKVQNKK